MKKNFVVILILTTAILLFSCGVKTERTKTETETTAATAEAKLMSVKTDETTGERQATGENGTLSFTAGETVFGSSIIFSGSTKPYTGLVVNSPFGGTVSNGVVNPWEEEIKGLTAISNDEIMTDDSSFQTPVNDEQPYVPHPRLYESTGITETKTWENLVVNIGEYLIIGGTDVTVNGEIYNNGVYLGYNPGTYTITVNNGFISIVPAEWGPQEFDFRFGQAITYGWSHNIVKRGPIPSK